MMRLKSLGVAVCVTAALILSGCSSAATTPQSAGGAGTLRLGVILPAATFDAANMNWGNIAPYAQAVYDSLLEAKPDGTIAPSLATKWSYDSTDTVLTLTLRTDVTFTDGTKFDAAAAVANLNRFAAGTSPQRSKIASMKDAVATSSDTVKITLTDRDPAFLTALTQVAGMQESPKAFDRSDVQTNPVGSGPYILDTKKTVVGSSYTFMKNPHYWNPSSVHYASIVMSVYTDPSALLNALKGSQLDASMTLNNDALDETKAAGYTINGQQLNWAGLMLLDRGGKLNPALADVRVRQAINYAFDTKALLKSLGQGYGAVTAQIFPTSSAAYDKTLDDTYPYNPTKAKALLAEAGYSSGLTLSMPTTAGFGPALPTLVKQQLKDVGITATFTDAGTNLVADILAPKYAATYFTLQEDTNDWQLINFQIAAAATWNPFHYDDPKVDAWMKTIRDGSSDDSTKALKSLNTYIVDQAWFAPWYRPQTSFVTNATTNVTLQKGNAFPYLWNIRPAS
jgi:peptide/nickel transport system substrate-binding protein